MQGAAGGGDCSKMLHKDGLLKPNDWLVRKYEVRRPANDWPGQCTIPENTRTLLITADCASSVLPSTTHQMSMLATMVQHTICGR
jgi:hypothetical protein